jgi:predicted nucleotidyltransferase
MAKREIIEILKQYIFILRSEGIIIDKAYLYGSYLANTATDDSDIDIIRKINLKSSIMPAAKMMAFVTAHG